MKTQQKACFDSQAINRLIVKDNINVVVVSDVTNQYQLSKPPLKANKILIIGKETSLPITLKYESKSTLGSDRIALACAVYDYSSANKLVIDLGTCITYDFIDSDNNYLGGSISPGVLMRLKAMNKLTAKLPEVPNFFNPLSLIGRTTQEAMLSGVYFGISSELKGFIDKYTKVYKNLEVYITGGDSKYFDLKLKNTKFVNQFLLLEGMIKILMYNNQRVKFD